MDADELDALADLTDDDLDRDDLDRDDLDRDDLDPRHLAAMVQLGFLG